MSAERGAAAEPVVGLLARNFEEEPVAVEEAQARLGPAAPPRADRVEPVEGPFPCDLAEVEATERVARLREFPESRFREGGRPFVFRFVFRPDRRGPKYADAGKHCHSVK